MEEDKNVPLFHHHPDFPAPHPSDIAVTKKSVNVYYLNYSYHVDTAYRGDM